MNTKKILQNYHGIENKLLIGLLVLCVVVIAYLLGKNQSAFLGASQMRESTPIPTIGIPTESPTTMPTNSYINQNNYVPPKVIQPTNTLIPQRKLVQVTLSDPQVSGTYYCYEDKANVIMNTQASLNVAIKTFNVCSDTKSNGASICIRDCGFTAQSCISNCYGSQDMTACTNNCTNQSNTCYDNCPKAPNCSLGDIDNYRNQLRQQIHDYCP